MSSVAVTSGTLTPPPALEPYPLDDVRHGLARVDRRLERLEDVLPADHHHRIDAGREVPRSRAAEVARPVFLEPMDLDEVPGGVAGGAQRDMGAAHLPGGVD